MEKQLEELLQGSSSRGNNKSASKFSFKRPTPNKPTSLQSTTTTSHGETPSETKAEVNEVPTAGLEGKGMQRDTPKSAVAPLRLHDRSGQFLTASDLFTPSDQTSSTSTQERDRITDISLSSLSNCIVDLTKRSSDALSTTTIRALHITGLKRCIVLVSFVEGSALIHDCEQCIIVLACRQVSRYT
jgi:hypothetical protein